MAKQIDPQKQELRFPVDWEFRVIVETAKAEAARPALAAVLEQYEQPPLLHNGLNSSSGRYQTFKAPATLISREMMEALAADLAAVEGVKFVL